MSLPLIAIIKSPMRGPMSIRPTVFGGQGNAYAFNIIKTIPKIKSIKKTV